MEKVAPGPVKVSILQSYEDRDETHPRQEVTIALLVLERGAEWPTWGTGIRMRAENSAVEVQLDSESTEEFEQRVLARLAQIQKQGICLVAAGYACALIPEDSDEAESAQRRGARRTIGTRILQQLAEKNGAELILAGGSWEITGNEGRQRSELIELWSELSLQAPGRLTSVRFEDPPSSSGVFRAAQKLEPLALESDEYPGRSTSPGARHEGRAQRASDPGVF